MSEEKPDYETLAKQVAEMRQADLEACVRKVEAALKEYRYAQQPLIIIAGTKIIGKIQYVSLDERPQ